MGLDMYVYRVHKPLIDESKLYDKDDLDKICNIVINESEITDPRVQQIIPYCTKVRAIAHYYNVEKIGRDYGLTNAIVGGWHYNNGESFVDIYECDEDNIEKSVAIPSGLIRSRYVNDREETFFVCENERIWYGRKDYEIQNWFHDNIPVPVENTGYYVLTEQILTAFNEAFPDILPMEAPNENCALVYWEWY